jgi:hypothetical protein
MIRVDKMIFVPCHNDNDLEFCRVAANSTSSGGILGTVPCQVITRHRVIMHTPPFSSFSFSSHLALCMYTRHLQPVGAQHCLRLYLYLYVAGYKCTIHGLTPISDTGLEYCLLSSKKEDIVTPPVTVLCSQKFKTLF